MLFVDPQPIELMKLLLSYGWTQVELSAALGVTQCSVSRIINGEQKPRRATVARIFSLAEEEAAKLRAFRERVLALYPVA